MDTTEENCSLIAAVPNGAYPVLCTEEVLLPFFSDESLPAAMASHLPPALPELRLVLLGRKGAGKSAAGNTVLGGVGGVRGFESGRPTEECVKRRADVAGRRVTVVDTPGWEWYYPLNSTPNWVRRETLRSVSLCPPGPHAVLLVVRSCTSVTDAYIQEMEEHLEPLGSEVWDHTMLLFTRGDELGLTTMEQRIVTSGPALQRLLKKCGNRYHVVNNLRRADGTQQVQELIRKLEQMVEEKTDGNSHLEMDSSVLLGLEADGKRRARERRKKQRQMEAQMQRGTIKAALMSDGPQGSELDAHHSFSKAPRRLHEVRLVLLGERETGKSSAGNTILGQAGFFQAGGVTEECVRRQAEVDKRLVTVVDTPGWEAGVAGATPERVRREIINGVGLCPPGPHALLLTLRVDTLVSAGHVREHLELLGEGVWRHTILLFTHGDQLREGLDFEQHIQGGGRDLQWLMEKCRGRYHVLSCADGGGRGSGGSTTVTELLEKVEKMATMNRCEAFSSLVQDVRDLSRQRNEKVNQRLKEMGDKMLRQELELKNVREREMKSIRWIFDWKRKAKSPGKANIQREEEEDEEEDRRTGERKQDFGELEERMRWLTEDKEREVQDLSVENERIRVALSQSGRERDAATLNLELREIEVEELRERIDEQQAKLLDLERAGVDKEQERKRREDAIRAKEQEWRKKLEETVEWHKREKAEWTERVESFKAEMDETKRHCDNVLERKEREMTELEKKLKREMEVKLSERDKEEEELRKRAAEEKRFSVKEKADEMEKVRQQHENEIRDMNEETRREIENLKKHFAKANEEHVKAKKQEIEKLEQKYHKQIRETLRETEKERETINSNHMKDVMQKIKEKDRELEDLKLQHQEEINHMEKLMEAARTEQQREMDRKVKEKEEDVERVQQQIRDMKEERKRANEEQREKFAKEVEKQTQERERQIRELQRKFSAQIEEREIMNQENEKCLLEKHLSQVEEKVRESEKEKERFEKEMEKRVEEKEKEIEEMKLNVGELKTELQQEKEKEIDYLNYKKEIEQRMREKEKEIEAMKLNVNEMKEKLQQGEEKETSYKKELEERLEEKDREIEGMREHAKRTEEKRERDRLKQKRQMMQKLEENEGVIEKLKEHIKDIKEIVERKEEEAEERLQDRGRRTEEMKLQLLNEMERRLKEKETEIESMRQEADSRETRWREEQETRDDEMKKLMEILKKKTEELTETQSLLAQRHREVEKVMEKLQEKEEALEHLRRKEGGNEKELVQLKLTIEQTKSELKNLTGKMEEEMTSLIREYEKEIARRDESVESISKDKDEAVARLEEESQRHEELQEQSEKMRKEAENFRFKYEELRIEKEERDLEVRALTEAGEKLQTEMELREQLERQMMERESEWRMKEEEMEKLLKREREVEEREKDTRRNEEELSKRRLELAAKEEELRKLEVNLETHRRERDQYEQGVKLRTQTIERKEREIESLLRALEVKQQELSSHGQDLQKNVKRLRDQGKELKEREHHLNNEERELISWKSELQTQNQNVDSTAQQLSEMGRDLALLKEELHRKETNLKTALKKWSKWEVELEAREAELHERNFEGGQAAVESSENNVFVMCREVREQRAKVRAAVQGESTKVREDQTMTTAQSAVKTDNCHHETLEEKETSEEKEEMRGRGGEMGEERGLERKQVVQDQRSLRVLVLGESWSSRCPAGVTILGGEEHKPDGSTFRSWRGQTAGRRLAVAEPLGLRWRDGPDPSNLKKSLLDGVSWCHPGPHVVLLLLPVFLACTRKYRRAVEEDMGSLGEGIWQRTLVVFTWGETLGVSAEQHILRSGELTGFVEKCGGRFHVLTSRRTNPETEGLFEKMEGIVASNSRGQC